jgi:hypothetical protein
MNNTLRLAGILMILAAIPQAYALERPTEQVPIQPKLVDVKRDVSRDLGFSFYVGSPIYQQGNDNLQYVDSTVANNTRTENVNTRFRPGLSFGFDFPLANLNSLQFNATFWNHTDRSNTVISNSRFNGAANLNYTSVDVLYGNNNLFRSNLCQVGLFGGLIYADIERAISNDIRNVIDGIIQSRTNITNRYSGIGPMAEGRVTITPFPANQRIILEGDLRGGVLYNSRDANTTTTTGANIQTNSIGRAHGGSTYVRAQAGVYYDTDVNGSLVRFGGGWQGRQYLNTFLEVQPIGRSNNLSLQGPFVIIMVRPKLIQPYEE